MSYMEVVVSNENTTDDSFDYSSDGESWTVVGNGNKPRRREDEDEDEDMS